MSIWTFGSVEAEPHVRLADWRILEASYSEGQTPTRHFAGCEARDRSGRISSAISSFDVGQRKGVTARGRVYELVGRSSTNDEAVRLWNLYCRINAVLAWTDVTEASLDHSADERPAGSTAVDQR